MKNLLQIASDFIRDEEGLTMVEYAVAGSLITAGCVGAFKALGGSITSTIAFITGTMAATTL